MNFFKNEATREKVQSTRACAVHTKGQRPDLVRNEGLDNVMAAEGATVRSRSTDRERVSEGKQLLDSCENEDSTVNGTGVWGRGKRNTCYYICGSSSNVHPIPTPPPHPPATPHKII